MSTNPFLGVLLHAVGGFAAGSFYIPFKKITGWAWETYWLTGGLFIWVFCPIVAAVLTVPELRKCTKRLRGQYWQRPCWAVSVGVSAT